jgi:UDP-GlcNAc:undecaprenyl-phosphate GlcNAc-1-phosphate transferase
VGGLSLVIGYIVGMLFLPVDVFDLTMLLGISTIPVFLGGFGEDMGFDVSPTKRLILSFISAVLAIFVFQTWVTDVGLTFLWFLTYGTFGSLVFTIVLTGGISHSINLIDGLNGLSMGVSMMISLGLAGLAYRVEDYSILMMCGVVLSSVAGLFIFNFPFDKIFLGDAGAYSMGHVLTWIGILLISRNPEIAPFSVMLLFFWPVMDMVFAIYRRCVPVDGLTNLIDCTSINS